MKANEANLLVFLKKSPQFIIPIYQRTYSWTHKEGSAIPIVPRLNSSGFCAALCQFCAVEFLEPVRDQTRIPSNSLEMKENFL
jgi:hypothetical protein